MGENHSRITVPRMKVYTELINIGATSTGFAFSQVMNSGSTHPLLVKLGTM